LHSEIWGKIWELNKAKLRSAPSVRVPTSDRDGWEGDGWEGMREGCAQWAIGSIHARRVEHVATPRVSHWNIFGAKLCGLVSGYYWATQPGLARAAWKGGRRVSHSLTFAVLLILININTSIMPVCCHGFI
jgi:hypothetical protein